ncbi:hypothetical protein B0H14DRAFT_3502078 [Mycena olivaceomarginata]|nr:hypothetical protein B0H14DRAFT_3502078 [Mycena olivaceomarginata]
MLLGSLPRKIFAIADEPPTWLGANDDEMGLKSISDRDEVEGEVGMDDGDISGASHAPSSNASHDVSPSSHVAVSTFSHTHQHHNSNSTTHSASTSSSDSKGAVGDAYAEVEGDGGFVDAGGEVKIKDDWIDPIAPPPAPAPIAKKGSKGKGKSKSKKAVPVSSVHYPFPVSAEDGSGAGTPISPRERGRERMITVSPRAAGVMRLRVGSGCIRRGRVMAGGWRAGACAGSSLRILECASLRWLFVIRFFLSFAYLLLRLITYSTLLDLDYFCISSFQSCMPSVRDYAKAHISARTPLGTYFHARRKRTSDKRDEDANAIK